MSVDSELKVERTGKPLVSSYNSVKGIETLLDGGSTLETGAITHYPISRYIIYH